MTKPQTASLVLGEIAKIEELTGVPSSQWDDSPQGKLLAALVFVFKRRQTPAYTWNEALGLSLEEAQEFLSSYGFGGDDADDEADETPTKPARKPARSKSA